MKPRLVVHIGAPKTGTTYLQSLLWDNAEYLRGQGVSLPGGKQTFHFRAGGDLFGPTGLDRTRGPHTEGMWKKFAKMVRRDSAPVVLMTDERLAGAPEDAALRVAELADHREIHIVYGARNLASLIPSAWQTQVRHGLKARFVEWAEAVLDQSPVGLGQVDFWSRHDIEDVVNRWKKAVERSDHIHLITVPKSTQDPDLLWTRFAKAAGIPERLPVMEASRTNTTLDYAQIEFLRRVNVNVVDELDPEQYRRIVRNLLSNRAMSGHSRGPGPKLPLRLEQKVQDHATKINDFLRSTDCDFLGDLEDLEPELSDAHKKPATGEVLRASIVAMSAMVKRIAKEN